MERIILFDGVCNLCDRSVQFIIKRDPQGKFKFAALQSEIGQELLKKHGFKSNISSFVLIENGKVYVKSGAAIRVSKQLYGIWKMSTIFLVIPPFIRDKLYDVIAKNRYKWFGKKDSCLLPSPKWKNRFLD
ncbi:thiol-disulfide oxidoreductase DCC family protein [Neobacillus sp. MM2021_6]|uniref:thiol-disulfide oxidoreductase DCC family protein n=1 Tax=Bacillaceae TaxID=186817 RepID=UPI001407D77E|nr:MULTISPECIES: thiol-disulfide oxidoreductase DCC family protein [Bacillaceae]MBO0960224.1 thiol-disulfide oxidoreductase DCC family protein [Neobacillus sp. MM2021_6]NHC18545.1 thiol-disulfide oxidoreductase DCC family protein [Bacillus sp. MM2020_4]